MVGHSGHPTGKIRCRKAVGAPIHLTSLDHCYQSKQPFFVPRDAELWKCEFLHLLIPLYRHNQRLDLLSDKNVIVSSIRMSTFTRFDQSIEVITPIPNSSLLLDQLTPTVRNLVARSGVHTSRSAGGCQCNMVRPQSPS